MNDNEIINLMRILGDEKRFHIFSILMTGTHCNCEITKKTGYSMNLISHHLKTLEKSGLVRAQKCEDDRRWIFYSVNKSKIDEFLNAVNNKLCVANIQERKPNCSTRKENCKK